jgi:hypothetical protein
MLGKTPSKQFTATCCWVLVQRVVGPGSGSLPGTGGSAGAEIGADVGCVGRAFLCLALRELEEGPGPSQPTLESWGGVFEAVQQGDAFLGDGGSVERENQMYLVDRR